MTTDGPIDSAEKRTPLAEIFLTFLRLGVTSFGGPIAHLGYFREEFVIRRQWLTDHAYGDLVALCQFLPGPASSEVGIALGLSRGGLPGAFAAWLGFTAPSAIALVLFGLVLGSLDLSVTGTWLHGLKVVAVAVVAQALWGMGKSLCADRIRATVAMVAALAAAVIPGTAGQVSVIVAGAAAGLLLLAPPGALPHSSLAVPLGRRAGLASLITCGALLALLPIAAEESGSEALRLFDTFYRTGALVFGGGHVVLPLLQAEMVPPGWVSNDLFLAGYGAAQAVPGPLFTFAAFLGSVSSEGPAGWPGAAIALVGIFLPAFLLVIGALPLWERTRHIPQVQRMMTGVNAAVVGLLLHAFYDPVWTSGILSGEDFLLALFAFLLLAFWKVAPWIVVVLCAALAGIGWH